MKKILSVCFCLLLVFSLFTPAVYAEEPTSASSGARLMPVDYYFTTNVIVTSNSLVPPGSAKFNVYITGTVDVQSGNYVTIESATCRYISGINCIDYDVYVEAWTDYSTGTVYFGLSGPIHFSYTSPVTGLTYDEIVYSPTVYSFQADNYV